MPEMMCMTEEIDGDETSRSTMVASASGCQTDFNFRDGDESSYSTMGTSASECQTDISFRGTESLEILVSEKEATDLYTRWA